MKNMKNLKNRFIFLSSLFLGSTISTSAMAQVDLEEDEDEQSSALDETDAVELQDDQVTEATELDSQDEDSLSAVEKTPPKKLQWFVGARYKMIILPKSLINVFGVDGGRTAVLNGGGVAAGVSLHENLDIALNLWGAGYGLKPTPFKGKKDSEEMWELVESNLKALYITFDFDWRFPIVKQLDFTVGVGAGLGIPLGDVSRTEAYFGNDAGAPVPVGTPGFTDPYTNLYPCVGPGNPPSAGGQCPADGDYGPSNPWPVYPWLNFQTGLRYQPHEHFIGRFQFGLGSSGFWFGLGADYGI
ncbi:MAG: hypothetical protein MK135_01330 [Polyangiaceae bacterium]|nr:hypothetical protein [Polyangiaceae bacterium]